MQTLAYSGGNIPHTGRVIKQILQQQRKIITGKLYEIERLNKDVGRFSEKRK